MKETLSWSGKVLLAGVVAGLLLPRLAGAQAYWRGDVYNDGVYDYSVGDHWSTGIPPGAGDGARFEGGSGADQVPSNADLTVRLTSDLTTASWLWSGGGFDMTLDLNGHSFTNTTTTFDINGAGVNVAMTGGYAELYRISPGNAAGSTGTLHLSGADMELFLTTAAGSGNSLIGASGVGTVQVTDSARLRGARMFTVGALAGSTGRLEVAGGGTFSNNNHIVIGNLGSAHLLVESGGRVVQTSSNAGIYFGYHDATESEVATALITGTNSLVRNNTTVATRGIIIGGDESAVVKTAGTVAVTVADHARMESNQRILIWDRHTLAIDNGTVTAGTNFEVKNDATLDMVLYTANRDALVQVVGNVELGETTTLNLGLGTGISFSVGQFVKLIQYGGTLSDGDSGAGLFENYAQDQVFSLAGSNLEFRFDYAYQPEPAGDNYIGLHVIPEPGSLLLLGMALSGLVFLRRSACA